MPATLSITEYVLIDGRQNPPSIIASTSQVPPAVARISGSPGRYAVTLSSDYPFLVGTSYGIYAGSQEYIDTILTATHKHSAPKVWLIHTVEAGVDGRSVDTMFGLVTCR